MNRRNLSREAVLAVWRESFETYSGLPEEERRICEPAVSALLAVLRGCDSDEELMQWYWQPGDWPAPVLLRQLPDNPDTDRLLTLEEAAFWMRHAELAGGDE